MQSHGGWIVFNRELYNYRELREELVRTGIQLHTDRILK